MMRRIKLGILLLILAVGTLVLAGYQPKPARAQLVLARPVSLEEAFTLAQEAAGKNIKTASALHVYVGRENTFTGGVAIDLNQNFTNAINNIRVRHEAMLRDLVAQAELRLPRAESEEERASIETLVNDLRSRLQDFHSNGLEIYALNVEGPASAIRQLLLHERVKAIRFDSGEVLQR